MKALFAWNLLWFYNYFFDADYDWIFKDFQTFQKSCLVKLKINLKAGLYDSIPQFTY